MKIGWERKIGYSFVGLMAGNVVSVVVLLLMTVLPNLDVFPAIRQVWKLGAGQALGLSIAIWLVSMLGWVVVGLPIVLLLRAEIVAEFYWITAALIGVVLGMLTMLVFLLAINQGRVDSLTASLRNPDALGRTVEFFCAAGLIAGVAFAVYCALVQAALRKQAKESGAPNGAPRSLPAA
jgi:hypothetical protein